MTVITLLQSRGPTATLTLSYKYLTVVVASSAVTHIQVIRGLHVT